MGGGASKDAPITSKLTASEVLQRSLLESKVDDLSGKVFIVTGANVGIGKETARALVEYKAIVICACRNPTKGLAVVNELNAEFPPAGDEAPRATFMQVDLADFASIQKFAEDFLRLARDQPLHCLINNAGVMESTSKEVRYTKQGFESMFGTNHLGTFFLTHLLLDKLKASKPSRIVNLSSMAQNLHMEENYLEQYPMRETEKFGLMAGMKLYGVSKAMNTMHAKKLHRLLADDGVTAYSVHPGPVKTELGQKDEIPWWAKLLLPVASTMMIPPTRGASTSIYCATHPLAESGKHFADCKVGDPNKICESEKAQDELWDMSVKIVEDWIKDPEVYDRKSNENETKEAEGEAKPDEANAADGETK